MKITFLIQDGTKQLVLTPELEADKRIFDLFGTPSKVKVFRGEYHYACQGGWIREGRDTDSLMLVIE